MTMHIILYKCLSTIQGNIRINITKKMPGPDVQQLPGGGGLTSYSFCTCPLYFAWVFLSYLMPSHFVLRPLHFILFFRGSTPPWHHTGIMNEIFLVYHEIPWYTIFFNLWWVQMFLSNWIKWLADIEWQWPDWCKVCPLINTFQAGELSQLIHALITPKKICPFISPSSLGK